MSEKKKSEEKLKVVFVKETEMIKYINVVFVNNSIEEFILDFGTISPGKEEIEIIDRVAISPGNAKRLIEALTERMNEYDKMIEEVKIKV